MKGPLREEKILLFIGVFFILLGITLNEYLLTALLSEDGVIASSARLTIWFFDGFCIMLGLLIIFSKSIKSFIIKTVKSRGKSCKVFIDFIFTGLIVLLLFAQFSYVVSALYHNQDNQGVIYATDADAGVCISITKGANWYAYHSTYGYGPLYFRLAHTLEQFAPNFDKIDKTEEERTEERIHFSLLLISLLSLYGMSFLFAHLLIEETKFKLLSTLLISTIFLNQYMWVNYVFRVHPDLLLSFLTALFLFLLYKLKNTQSDYFLYLSALIGGAALSAKQAFLLFLPSLIFLEIPPFSKEKFLKLFKLYLMIAFSYFIIGFPQNFRIDQNISFLSKVSKRLHRPPTWESFVGWWSQLLDQGWQLLLMMTVLFIVFGTRKYVSKHSENKYLNLRLWAVAFFPFVFLLARKIISAQRFYTLPFVAILLTVSAIWFSTLDLEWLKKIKDRFNRDMIKYAVAVLLLGSIEMTIGIVPGNIEKVLNGIMHNRKEAKVAYAVINSYLDDGKKVLVEAFVPFNSSHENIIHGGHLTMTLELLNEYKPDVIALNQLQLPRIMEGERPSDYMIGARKNYREIRQYYNLFYKKNETIDPFGQKWVKTYEDTFGVEIWEKH